MSFLKSAKNEVRIKLKGVVIMFRQFVQETIGYLSELNLLFQYLGTFFISFIPFMESPGGSMVGSLIGIPIIFAVLISILGNLLSIMFIIALFNTLQMKIRNRDSKKGFIHNRAMRARELYAKYGVPGLALIAPLVASGHIAAFTSLALGVNKRRVVYWHIMSIVLWGMIGGAFGGYLYYDIIK